MTPAQLFDRAFVQGYPISYHTAKKFVVRDLIHLEYCDATQWQETHSWCNENFGEQYSWAGNTFAFKTAEDALLFKLAWG